MKNKIKRLLITVFSVLILYFLGVLIKEFIMNVDISNTLFSICHTTNTGSAFGMFQNSSSFLSVFGIVVLILVFAYIYKTDKISKVEQAIVIIFSSGALGNIVERVTIGHVVDYIKLNFIDFPVFNIYDVMICSAVCLYCILFFRDLKNENNDNIKQ